MKKKIMLTLCMAAAMVASCFTITVSAEATEASTSYYIDSAAGNDESNGTSEDAAWKSLEKVNSEVFKPGDKILFKKGGVWSGKLTPQGSGEEESPITIDSYGEGEMPILNGDGVLGGTIELYNQEYWTIQNLEITNNALTREGNARSAILVRNQKGGLLNGIHILDNYIHDVKSSFWHYVEYDGYYHDAHEFGGISVTASGCTGTELNSDADWVPVNDITDTYNDVLIEGNTLERVGRTGIIPWVQLGYTGNDRDWTEDVEAPENAMTNVVIRNNYLSDIDGDGIFTHGVDGALVEYNTANRCGRMPANAGALPPNEINPDNDFTPCVAIWLQACWDTVFQYNESLNTMGGGGDRQGFDFDYYAYDSVLQYNYSHDNNGGFALLMGKIYRNAIRYNIVQESESRNGNLFQDLSGGDRGEMLVYNNVFYTAPDSTVGFANSLPNTTMKNNIIYWNTTGGYPVDHEDDNPWARSFKGTWDNNLYYGNHPDTEPDDPNKMTEDPMLAGPGTGKEGFDSLDGYKLMEGSPAIGAGTLIENNGGKDFWGNEVSATEAPNLGAYSGTPLKEIPQSLLEEEEESKSTGF